MQTGEQLGEAMFPFFVGTKMQCSLMHHSIETPAPQPPGHSGKFNIGPLLLNVGLHSGGKILREKKISVSASEVCHNFLFHPCFLCKCLNESSQQPCHIISCIEKDHRSYVRNVCSCVNKARKTAIISCHIKRALSCHALS